mmetsp:Transcript_138606/g.351319  ORF Transcript_138606/g.351319 Transcript_138606/m.351319 type:complete len:88 (+) Transcript_138606:649-912(+)
MARGRAAAAARSSGSGRKYRSSHIQQQQSRCMKRQRHRRCTVRARDFWALVFRGRGIACPSWLYSLALYRFSSSAWLSKGSSREVVV